MSKLIKYIISAAAALALSACSDEMPRGTEVNEEGFHVYKLDMDIAFDGEEGSRAAHQWTSSEYVYINFNTGNTPTWGYAYYNTSYDTWNLYMVTELPENVRSGNCTCWFFSNNYQHSISTSTEQINLNYDQIPYQAETTFTLVNDKVSISAKMNPAMGRFKLRCANAWSSVSFLGPSVPKYLDLKTGQVILGAMTQTFNISNTNDESGLYTSDYINAYYFDDDTERPFKIKINNLGSDNIFVRNYANNKDVLAPGSSGYIDVPTQESHEGWTIDSYWSYNRSYLTYGDANKLSPEENTYYFNTVTGIGSKVGIQASINHRVSNIYNGTEATKKTAMLYIEVFDGEPTENSEALAQRSIYIYKPDLGFDTEKTYETILQLTLPETVKTTNTPYYRVSVLTDGVSMYLTSIDITNWF